MATNLSVIEKIEVVREARYLFGDLAARQLWFDLKLPPPPSPPKPSARTAHVSDFLKAEVIDDASSEEGVRDLYRRYERWHPDQGVPKLSIFTFGKGLRELGLRSRHNGSGTIYVCLRLRSDPPHPLKEASKPSKRQRKQEGSG